ncbi:hypothetical protein Slin14017_G020700 [Septoria linicola]|nr:hypothetical protein Slin14017_G020700 [Septoria linicola]
MGRQDRPVMTYYQSECGPVSTYSASGSSRESSPTCQKRPVVVVHKPSGVVPDDEPSSRDAIRAGVRK